MTKPCNPNHPLLRDHRGPLKVKPDDGLPATGTRARVLYSLLKDRRWHSVQECYDYVKARLPHQSSLDRTHFGQRILNLYIEVCITDDNMVRLGKPRP